MNSGKLYSVEDAAAFLGGVSRYSIYAWVNQGRLKKTKIGTRVMISERDLQSFLDQCNPEPSTAPSPSSITIDKRGVL